ncbi:amino acid ABC transporter permease [Sedimenticola sp.]|uniref:amino acid ABC transporter permease n=1 Tax=Sedimenticola sp. TaxID=1940285 RepID=UPI003D0D5701
MPSKPPPWNDPKVRALVFQVLVSLVVAFTIYYLIRNTLHNMELRGISTGFGFLSSEAGFGITQTLVEYDETHTYGRTFLVGLLNTILVSALGIICATVVGFVMGVARLSTNWLINKIAAAYIEIFRNIPLLLQIFFWYFSVFVHLPRPRNSINIGDSIFLSNRGLYVPRPVAGEAFWVTEVAIVVAIIAVVFLVRWARKRQEETGEQFHTVWASIGILTGLPLVVFLLSGAPMTLEYPELRGFNFSGGISMIPELAALLFALTVYTGTFIAETVRAGIQSVSHGQTEAARALGLRSGPTLRLVIIPQAMRVIVPPLTSQYLNLTKNSSLAAAIGYPDLVAVFAGTTLNQTGQAVEVIAMTMAVYLTLSLTISLFMNWYNARMALQER